MSINFAVVWPYIPDLLPGLRVTLVLTGLTLLIGMVIGLPVALMRISGRRWLAIPAAVYTDFFRTTPPLVQIFWVFYVLPYVLGLQNISAFTAATLALGCNIGAFMAEIYRAGIQAVPSGQRAAAHVLGLSPIQAFRLIVLPQAIRVVIPSVGATSVLLIKSTSLAAGIAVFELTYVANLVSDHTFRSFEVYAVVAGMYFLVAYPMSLGVRKLERRMRVSV